MKSLWFKALPVLACLLIAAGCNSHTRLGNILVDITEYRSGQTDNQAQLTLRYTNENIFPIAIGGTTGKLYFNGEYIGKVEQNNAVGLQQLNTATRTGTLLIENPALLQKIRSSTASKVSYRLESNMRFDVGEEKMKIKTEYSGQIDANSLQAAPSVEKK